MCCAAAEEDSYTKEETKSTRFVNLVHAASLNQASAVANGQVHSAPSGEPLGPPPAAAQQVLEQGQRLGSHDPEPPSSVDEEQMDGAGWPSLGGTAWASKAAAAAATQVPSWPIAAILHGQESRAGIASGWRQGSARVQGHLGEAPAHGMLGMSCGSQSNHTVY